MHHRRRISTVVAVAGLLAVLAPPDASAAQRGRGHRRVIVRPAVGFYTGPFWGGFGHYGFSGFYSGWGPGYWGWGAPYLAGDAAELRIQVEPRETEVFVDGHYAGVVDDFDGTFQRLRLEPGNHVLELYLEGHRSLRQDIYVGPGGHFKLKHRLEALAAGESQPARPQPPAGAPGVAASPQPASFAVARGRVPARPARPAGGFGELLLHTQPSGAEVWIDGERWPGDAAGRLSIHLPAGVHRIELRHAGHQDFATELEIRAGETRELNVRLPSGEASL